MTSVNDFKMPQTRSSSMRQTQLNFIPIPSSSPIGTPEKRAAFYRTENCLTPSKTSSNAPSSASKLSSGLKIFPAETMVLPTPAPSSQIGQKDEESSDSTQTESEIPVGSRIFGRYARRGASGSNALPLTPQSGKKSDSKVLTPSEAVVFNETLKRKTDERKPPFRKLRRKLSSSVGTVSSSSNEDDVRPSLFRRKRQATFSDKMTDSSSNEGSSEDIISPKRRKRYITRNMPDLPEKDSDSEVPQNQVADDLKEDLDDLRDSNVCTQRTRGKIVNTERTRRQKQLELLKRRRDGGETIDLSSNSETLASSTTKPSGDKRKTYHRPSPDEISDTDHDSAVEAIRKSLRADADENDSSDDFISENEGFLGVHGLEDIPFELTRHAHKKPFEHFKDAVEWIVHNKLNPAFPRNDVIYRIAFRKIDDEVQGYSGSKFVSAVWNKDFLQTLKALPELAVRTVLTMLDHKCDACNRSKHPAKHELVFSGKPYDIDTLEDIEEDDDEDDDDDDAGAKKKTSRPADTDQSRSFYLGSACAANAETAHGLIHWKYYLNYYVCNWLTNHGHTTCHKIIERENWSTKKRTKYANDVVDDMVKTGEMKILYKEFKENLDTARSVIPGRYGHGRR